MINSYKGITAQRGKEQLKIENRQMQSIVTAKDNKTQGNERNQETDNQAFQDRGTPVDNKRCNCQF